ncbi:Lrp/AsnC family transcriptional regulator [Pyrococcus abyssi]|uniref:Putative HTH transcription regulator n=1 Tax=Pyrococcus abyssi (strain GE5 / Orsay) TaxID=272844 RepID=Q9UY13_PYRAB|nr:Lrp/AsnC family transcriptional regulator [Pyrococcus abyssi]CAB50599.1 Hypothetical protein PAB1110 [Pyrococcus abyssi GE5]CCE71165.1 TPA: Putative HTH transcription regulator [Pyrococcus abyssi GE5]
MRDTINFREIEWLLELLNKYPRESLRKISQREGIEYYRLKRIYDRYYGKYIFVSAIYDIAKLGLKSYIAFLSVPKGEIFEVGKEMLKNPFISYINPIFGFKNGIQAILHVPVEQEKYVPELLSKYSDDFEYYEVWSRDPSKVKFGKWSYSYEYAILLDTFKVDARTPMKELEKKLSKGRPTIKFMIEKLIKDGIIVGFYAFIENAKEAHDRSVVGIAKELDKEEIYRAFKEEEINIGILRPRGYYVEWFFSSREDIGSKILEFSQYVDKIGIAYLDMFRELNNKHMRTRFSRMIKEDGSGYKSILEF